MIGVVSLCSLLTIAGCSQPIVTGEQTANSIDSAAPTDETNSPTASPTDAPATLTVEEQKFVAQVAQNSMAEVELGQLATRQATSNAVKQFGQRMSQNHLEMNRQMAQLVAAKDATMPQDMGERNQAVVQRLSTLSGTEFDRAYMNQMVDAHRRDLELLQQKAQQGQDADLKQLAASQVPILQDHLQLAREIAQNLNR